MRRLRLSLVLWAAFLASVAASGILLLRACGLIGPAIGWNYCPTTPLVLSSEAARFDALRNRADALALEIARRELACASTPKPPPPPFELPRQTGAPRPQQTALLKPPPLPPPPPPPPAPRLEPPPPSVPLPADRWAQRDLTLLQGCWQLGRDTHAKSNGELCTIRAGRICLGNNGAGQREETWICPRGTATCSAPITATFGADGSLGTTQPETLCSDGDHWFSKRNSLTCRRVSDTLATCISSWNVPYEFQRE